jgi:DHA1 family inner membrane transport protein
LQRIKWRDRKPAPLKKRKGAAPAYSCTEQRFARYEKREEKQIPDSIAATGTSTAEVQTGTRSSAIAMYCVLLVAYSLMAADRYLFPFLNSDVRKEFGFSVPTIGLLSTIFTLGLGIGGLPTGYLMSRFSRKTVLSLGIAIFSGATMLTTVATGFWTMLLCLAVTGIGMAMLATSIFALAASYFIKYRAAAIGSVNLSYGIGGFYAPILASAFLVTYKTWRAPMIAFGLFGFVTLALILIFVRSWFSETRRAAQTRADARGASSLMNRNSIILTVLSVLHGFSMYGFLGMYTYYLREGLHYPPRTAAGVIGFFGVGALTSIFCGWLGDRMSPRVVLTGAFLCSAVLGYLFFHGASESVVAARIMTCAYGVIASAILYVNLAGYHVKAVRGSLANRASGMFVTSLYAAAAFAGSLMGWIEANHGWPMAGVIQMSVLSIVGAVLTLALRPSEMAL